MKYLPSPKIIALFLLVLALGTGGWVWFFHPFSEEKSLVPAARKTASPASNWEDELRKLTSQSEVRPEEDTVLATNFTEQVTSALSEALGPRLISEGGLKDLSPAQIQKIASVLPKPETILGEISPVRKTDLIITAENNPDAVKKYFNQVYKVYEKTFLPIEKDDLAILSEALANDDFGELQKIDPILAAFDQSFQEVKKIPVPKGWENFALNELNHLLKSRRAVAAIRSADQDPLSALAALSVRITLSEEIHAFYQETYQKLSRSGIGFEPGEGGYLLLQ